MSHRRRLSAALRPSPWRCAASVCVSIVLAASGCGLLGLVQDDCNVPEVAAPVEPLPPISAALRYLQATQFEADLVVAGQVVYAGDWPQCFTFQGTGWWVRDTSPFMATFVHHALALVTAEHQRALGVSDADVQSALHMRKAAVALVLRFQARPDAPDAGTFGFWPDWRQAWLPGDLILATASIGHIGGPEMWGVRAPASVSFFPRAFAIPTDADDTATVYAALLDHARLDGGPAVSVPFERFFADWRDLGQVVRRNQGPWLPAESGAYLTWLAYDGAATTARCNDVDPVVNANVLYVLGRYGRLDTPGVADAAALINTCMQAGAHRTDAGQLSLYYPDNLSLHYCVTRAYAEGAVAALAPAADLLVADLLASAKWNAAGHCYWDRGDSSLNTALAVLALLNAGWIGPEVAGAIEHLIATQDPASGGWEAGAFFRGRFDRGQEAVWFSPALTTAMALEALCRYMLTLEATVSGK